MWPSVADRQPQKSNANVQSNMDACKSHHLPWIFPIACILRHSHIILDSNVRKHAFCVAIGFAVDGRYNRIAGCICGVTQIVCSIFFLLLTTASFLDDFYDGCTIKQFMGYMCSSGPLPLLVSKLKFYVTCKTVLYLQRATFLRQQQIQTMSF